MFETKTFYRKTGFSWGLGPGAVLGRPDRGAGALLRPQQRPDGQTPGLPFGQRISRLSCQCLNWPHSATWSPPALCTSTVSTSGKVSGHLGPSAVGGTRAEHTSGGPEGSCSDCEEYPIWHMSASRRVGPVQGPEEMTQPGLHAGLCALSSPPPPASTQASLGLGSKPLVDKSDGRAGQGRAPRRPLANLAPRRSTLLSPLPPVTSDGTVPSPPTPFGRHTTWLVTAAPSWAPCSPRPPLPR